MTFSTPGGRPTSAAISASASAVSGVWLAGLMMTVLPQASAGATFHDVSNTHDGYEISADYSYRWVRGRFTIAPSVGVAYKSAELSDYYWGVHADEVQPTLQGYQVDGGIGWEAGLRTSYYITKSMRVAVSANYEQLTHNIALSPLVAEPYVIGYFAGLAWQF